MTIREYCESLKDCNGCMLNGLCKGTDREKYKPKDYSYSEDMWATYQLNLLAEILKQ